MANIMQMFKAKNKPSREAFDLSKKNAFTAKSGELLVAYSKLLMSGDVVDAQCKWITRTKPVNTAAYTRIREYYDWFFVPMNLLWDKYNTWFTNMVDNEQVAASINGNSPLTDKHPYFTVSQLHSMLNDMDDLTIDQNLNNNFGFKRSDLIRKNLHYMGYGDYYEDNLSSKVSNAQLSPWRALAYQKIYQDYYRNSQWETARPELFNLNYISGAEGTLNIPLDEMDLTKWTMFDIRYANWNKDYFMGLLPNSQYGDAASVDAGSFDININTPTFGEITNDLPYSLRASAKYLPANDDTGESGQSVYADYSIGSTSARTGVSTSSYKDPVTLTTKLTYNGATYSGSVIGGGYQFVMTASDLKNLRNALGINSTSASTAQQLNSSFTILALRQAEMLQKFREITQSNPKDFPSQVEAHFGVRPSNAYSQRCQWIGGTDGNIDISEVVNTNITENSDSTLNGADIAGKGVGVGSGKVHFKTDVPGVLMCIYHNAPLLDYSIDGIHADNLKTLFTDYAIPEFDKVGMQQIPLVQLTNKIPDGTGIAGSWSEVLLGYAPRYIDYKTDIDEVHGAFYNGSAPLTSWVSPINNDYITRWLTRNQGNATVWNGLNYSFFKVNPSTLDPIFSGEAANSSVDTDQFLINCYFDIKMARNLDRDGLPY